MKKIFLTVICWAGVYWPLSAQAGFSMESRDPSPLEKKQELLRSLREGSAVIGKAIVVQEGSAICSLDLKNREGLVPPFAKSVPENFRSSIKPSEHIPPCGEKEISRMPHRDDFYIVEGDQTAFFPLVIGLGAVLGGGIGCSIGYFQELVEKETMVGFGVSLPLLLIPVTYFFGKNIFSRVAVPTFAASVGLIICSGLSPSQTDYTFYILERS